VTDDQRYSVVASFIVAPCL